MRASAIGRGACARHRRQAGWPWLAKVLCLLAAGLTAATGETPRSGDWIIDGWQTDAGLPHNAVTALCQTRDGYLWVGTSNGLARFDGVRFTSFRVADGLGLRSGRVLCLHQDTRGVLWVGTAAGGLAAYEQGHFSVWLREQGLSSETVLSLGEGPAGELWVGTDSGLNRLQADRWVSFFKSDGLPDDRVMAVCQPTGAQPLFATARGLCRFNQDVLAASEMPIPVRAQTNLVLLHQDSGGGLWLGGEAGLWRVSRGSSNTPARAVELATQPVLCLAECRSGEAWFGTGDGGLWRVDTAAVLVPERVWQAGSAITAVREDAEGNIWAGTAGQGLFRLKRPPLRLLSLPDAPDESGDSCVFELPAGALGVVTADGRFYQVRPGYPVTMDRLPLPEGAVVDTVSPTPEGQLWLGTQRDGLFLWSSGSLWQFSEQDGLSDSAVEVILPDPDGGVWVGTRNGGLNHLKDGRIRRVHTPWGFRGTHACALARDNTGGLWIGTSGDGLFRLHEGRFAAWSVNAGLPSGEVRALLADADGTVWVGTARGLCRLRGGQLRAFGGSGLPDEAVLQLRGDAAGQLWIGTSRRILRVAKADLHDWVEGRTRFVSVVPYGKEDGLPDLQCLPQARAVASPGAPGEVWLATSKGVVIVPRPKTPDRLTPPPVVLEAVLVENVSVPFAQGVRVPPGKESLRFEYTALSLTAPGKVNFRYRLDGFDRDWSEASPARAVRYPKLPPGRYAFHVVACNHEGAWNQTGARVAVEVAPFWWATGWFRLTVAGLLVGGLAGIYRLRRARQQELERLRVRIASDLHDDIGSSLWSITLLSRMLAKHGNLGAEERHDVEEIHRIATQTANAIRDIIWLINPSFDTLQDLVLRTKDFAGVVLRGVDYHLHCQGVDLSRKLPFEFRHNLFLLFKEALTNVARHARATAVHVRIEECAGGWRFTIQDNGVGFDPASAGAGHGLGNLRARAAKMGADLQIESAPGCGTLVRLTTRLG